MTRRFLALLDTPAGRAARYAFSALLVGALVWSVNWRQFTDLRGPFASLPVALAALVAGVTFPLHAWRWWLLLRAQGVALSLPWAHVVTWIGNFYNAFLLGGLGGDAAKAFYVCRDAPSRAPAGLAATVLDRVLGLVVLLSIAGLTLLLRLDAVARHAELRFLLGLCAALSLASLIVFVVACRRPPRWLARWLGETHTATFAEILQRTGSARGALVAALALSYLIWWLDFVSVWLLARSIGFPLPFIEVSLAMSVAYAATVLPVSVGGHGIREGAMLGTFALLGLLPTDDARQHALLLAVLIWAIGVLWSLAGGLVLLFSRPRATPAEPAAPPPTR